MSPIVDIDDCLYFSARYFDQKGKKLFGFIQLYLPDLEYGVQSCLKNKKPQEFNIEKYGLPKISGFWHWTYTKKWLFMIQHDGVLKKIEYKNPQFTVKRSKGTSFFAGLHGVTALNDDLVVAKGLELNDALYDFFQLYDDMTPVNYLKVRLPESCANYVGSSVVNPTPYLGNFRVEKQYYVHSVVKSVAMTLIVVDNQKMATVQVLDLLAIGVATEGIRMVDVRREGRYKLRAFLADKSHFVVRLRC